MGGAAGYETTCFPVVSPEQAFLRRTIPLAIFALTANFRFVHYQCLDTNSGQVVRQFGSYSANHLIVNGE